MQVPALLIRELGMHRMRPRVAVLCLVAISLAAWGGVLAGTFHYDDFANVVRDGATADLTLLPSRLLHGVRPLLRFTYWLDHVIWGLRPAGFLLTNFLLHLATVLGVYALAARRLQPFAALLAASVFSLQPADVEVVAWVSGRSTGLATALLVAGLAVNAGATRGRARAMLAGSLFVAACLAKEIAVVFPLFIWLWGWTRREDEPAGALGVKPAIAIAIAATGLFALSTRYRELLLFSLGMRGPVENLLASASVLPDVLSLWFRPGALAIAQPPPVFHVWAAWLGAAMALALLASAVFARRRSPLVALAAGWILVALLPTHSLIAKIELVTAKPLYLAWVGPSLLLGHAGTLLLRRAEATREARALLARTTAAAIASALIGAGVLTAIEVRTWADEVALWSRAVERSPSDPIAWNDLGSALFTAGRKSEAVRAFRRAVELDPANVLARQNVLTGTLLCADCAEEIANGGRE